MITVLNPSNITTNGIEGSSVAALASPAVETTEQLLQLIEKEYQQSLLNPLPTGRWRSLSEMDLWYLLCRCILSEVRYETALSVVEFFRNNGQLNPYLLASYGKAAKKDLTAKLSALLESKKEGRQYSQYFVANAKILLSGDYSLSALLNECRSGYQARKQLCSIFQGVGLKEASMFLRDSCYAHDTIVVDGPILKYLQIVDPPLVEADVSLSQINQSNYLMLEYLFCGYCETRGANPQRMERAIRKVLK